MNVDATQTGIVFQYHQVQMIVGISCLVVVFQEDVYKRQFTYLEETALTESKSR